MLKFLEVAFILIMASYYVKGLFYANSKKKLVICRNYLSCEIRDCIHRVSHEENFKRMCCEFHCSRNNLLKNSICVPLEEFVMEEIKEFKGEYRWLSNFHTSPVEFEGKLYPSVEHAYQAAKSLDEKVRENIAGLPMARDAKKIGGTLQLRSDWNDIKYGIMFQCVNSKFTLNKELAQKLIDTTSVNLIEGNWWKDTYWGVCNGVGQNNLGKILMEIR